MDKFLEPNRISWMLSVFVHGWLGAVLVVGGLKELSLGNSDNGIITIETFSSPVGVQMKSPTPPKAVEKDPEIIPKQVKAEVVDQGEGVSLRKVAPQKKTVKAPKKSGHRNKNQKVASALSTKLKPFIDDSESATVKHLAKKSQPRKLPEKNLEPVLPDELEKDLAKWDEPSDDLVENQDEELKEAENTATEDKPEIQREDLKPQKIPTTASRDDMDGEKTSPMETPPKFGTPGTFIDESRLTERPGNRKPQYPWMARVRRAEGVVIIAAYVKKDGSVDIPILYQSSGHPILDQEALKTYASWRYQPGTSGWVKKPFSFKLNDALRGS